ncbi:unnamed protein product [Effrenium voratum]|nr:unnamed protein product [Effrenium voratum]
MSAARPDVPQTRKSAEVLQLGRNAAHYATAIRDCAKGSSWQAALSLFEEMQQQQVERDTVVVNAALTACRGSGRWQLALSLLASTRIRTIVTYNATISAMGASLQWQLALVLLAEVPRRALRASSVTYTSSVIACEAASAWEAALTVFAAAPDASGAVDRALRAVGAHSWSTALAVIDQAKAAGVESYDLRAAASACKASWRSSLAIWPNPQAYSEGHCWQAAMAALRGPGAGLDAAARAECWQAALGLLFGMEAAGVEPSPADLNSVAVALENQGMQELLSPLLRRGFRGQCLRRRPWAPRSFLEARGAAPLSLRRLLRAAARPAPRAARLQAPRARRGLRRRLEAWAAKWAPQPLPWCGDGFAVEGSGLHEAHLSGELYFQEATSMLPPAVLAQAMDARKPGEHLQVLDLCAAPGSKATQLGAWLRTRSGGGLLIANEPSHERADKLRTNLLRSGLVDVLVTRTDGQEMGNLAPEAFDAILLDAPCSCEGNVRKEPVALLRGAASSRGPKNPLVRKQRALLQSAWRALKSGGVLVYSTCTFDAWQNQKQCAKFLEAHRDATALDADLLGGSMLQVLPHRWDTEGFFVAAFQKHVSGEPRRSRAEATSLPPGFHQLSKEKEEEIERLHARLRTVFPMSRLAERGDEVWMLPCLGSLSCLWSRCREPGLLLTKGGQVTSELQLAAPEAAGGAPRAARGARGWAKLLADVFVVG